MARTLCGQEGGCSVLTLRADSTIDGRQFPSRRKTAHFAHFAALSKPHDDDCAHAYMSAKGAMCTAINVETGRVDSLLPKVIGFCGHAIFVECLEAFHTVRIG
jgi:hypothetical protein